MEKSRSPQGIMLAYAVSARLVELHGDAYIPFFEFMEHEVEQLQNRESVLDRARRASELAENAGLNPKRLGYTVGYKRSARR